MKLWKPRTRFVVRAICMPALTAIGTIAASHRSLSDDYYSEAEPVEQTVEQVSDVEPIVIADGHEPALLGDEAMHTESWHEGSTSNGEWVDPTITETSPCTEANCKSCPGVCKDPGHPKKPKHPRPRRH
jgi:hypothetical protein